MRSEQTSTKPGNRKQGEVVMDRCEIHPSRGWGGGCTWRESAAASACRRWGRGRAQRSSAAAGSRHARRRCCTAVLAL
eukprot:765171-Hanusia_phi.AAC.5